MGEAKETDTARWDELNAARKAEAETLATLKAEYDKAKRNADHQAAIDETRKMLETVRTPSKAGLVGFGRSTLQTGYSPGTFISAVATASNPMAMPEDRQAAKAILSGLGSRYQTPDEAGSAGTLKATTGLTDAAGGWILPNAVVDDLIKVGKYESAVSRLVTRRTGLGGTTAVDIPYRTSDASRAAVIAWGSLKTNVDLTYGGYTATLYTLAQIYDVTNQFLRKSAGAAEADVLDELARAFALGEAYYILQGSGSSEPYGLQTAITNAPATFTSSTVAAAATRAGSIITIISNLAGTVAGRNRKVEAAVVNPAQLWLLASQGTENAGFFLDVLTDPTSPTIRVFGIPVYGDNNLAGTDDLIVGEWSALKVYYGDGMRIDSSNVANTRWDYNLTGFRGEMEMGLDARPAVYAGAFQFQADIVP
jgi:HK97 family phage major capsid protein